LTKKDRNAWGSSLFCDDIRAEVGGKMSVMGIYQTDMIFPSQATFPLALPKFCALIKYYETLDAFKDDVELRVFLPGDEKDKPSVVIPFPRSSVSAIPLHPLEEDQERIFNLTFPLMISPFAIKQEGFVKIRAKVGKTTTNLGSLMVRTIRPDEVIQGMELLNPPPAF
jgi:hypothetical protein